MWHKQDTTFKVPRYIFPSIWSLAESHRACRATILVDIITPVAYESPESTVLAKMFARLLQDSLNEFSYDADVAGLGYTLNNSQTGFQVCYHC